MDTNSCVNRSRRLILIALVVAAFNSSAEGEVQRSVRTCEHTVTLEEFRAFALKNSPIVGEIDRDFADDLASGFETERLLNPELQLEQTFTGMDVGGADDPQTQVSIGQPFRISHFGTRAEVARLIRKSGDLQKRAKLLELVQKLTLQFRTLSAYQQIAKILSDAENRAAKKVSIIREGVRKGLFSEGEEHLFEGEKFRLQAQGKNISSRIAALQNELSRTSGLPCQIAAAAPIKLEPLPSQDDLMQKASSNELSETSRVNLASALTKEQVRLSELDAFPQITPRLMYQHTNDGGDFFGGGISIPLPFWDRNQASQYRTDAENKLAKIRSEYLGKGGLQTQLSTLRQAALNAQEQMDLYLSRVVPSFEKAFHAQEKLYAEGKGNVLQVWQTLRAYNEVQTQGLQFSLEAVALRIQLSMLVGEEI